MTTKKRTPKTSKTPKPSNRKGSAKHLVIVESPAKAKTVGRYLGSDYVVMASGGHVRDLPGGRLGVNVDSAFAPEYVVIKGKQSIIVDLKREAQGVESIYLATDPDREGEAISWHLTEAIGWKQTPIRRVVFHEITPEAIKDAFAHYRSIDMRLVNAQQARRVLDRLVGYQLSPLLWRKVQRGLSAGRVQSVALRMVVERDQEIEAFTPVEYWSLKASLQPQGAATPAFTASLYGLAGQRQRLELPDQATAESVRQDLQSPAYTVGKVTRREVKRRPTAPFITSSLQQESWRQLRFSATRTMALAQQLYEGLPIGGEGNVGLITYMRTDSPQVAVSAVDETRSYVQQRWGKEYLPASAWRYTSRSKVAQEAHEAIRPTVIGREPQAIRAYLSWDHLRLYDLIWKRMVASQMADAILDSTQVEVGAPGRSGRAYVFRASGSVLKFPGFRALYEEARDDAAPDPAEDQELVLPALQQGQGLVCHELDAEQHFTQPPSHYTEASLIRNLEEKGIGRPSTYAPIVGTLVDRQYATRDRGTLHSTRLGQVVSGQLLEHFPNIMDTAFTAQLEEQLDDVANGKLEWVPLLSDFYGPFSQALERAQEEMPRVRVEEPTDEICEVCGRPMVIKRGRFGPFLSCSGFPECRNSRPLVQKTGAKCPQCGGDLVQRRGKGRVFYGCSNYPECTFTVSQRPLEEPCPECGGLLVASGRDNARCTKCAYQGPIPEPDAVEMV